MRVAPIGLYIVNPLNVGKFATEASVITHGHPLGIIPSYVFSSMIYYLVKKNLSIKASLDKAMTQYKEEFNIFDKETNEYFINLINKSIELSKKNISDVYAISEIGEGWVAEEAFAIAIYSCLKYNKSFKDAIVCAVNHDGDSDSAGSIAGNIMGAYLGYNKIPNYYIDNLELKDIIIELAEDLSVPIPAVRYQENNDEYWLNSACIRNEKLKKV